MNTTNADERSYWEVRSALGESVCAVSHLGQQELFFLMYPPPPSKLPIKGELWKLNSFRKEFWAVRGGAENASSRTCQLPVTLAPLLQLLDPPGADAVACIAASVPNHTRVCKQEPFPPHRVAPRGRGPSRLPGLQHLGLEPRPSDFKQQMCPLRTKQRTPPSKGKLRSHLDTL